MLTNLWGIKRAESPFYGGENGQECPFYDDGQECPFYDDGQECPFYDDGQGARSTVGNKRT